MALLWVVNYSRYDMMIKVSVSVFLLPLLLCAAACIDDLKICVESCVCFNGISTRSLSITLIIIIIIMMQYVQKLKWIYSFANCNKSSRPISSLWSLFCSHTIFVHCHRVAACEGKAKSGAILSPYHTTVWWKCMQFAVRRVKMSPK